MASFLVFAAMFSVLRLCCIGRPERSWRAWDNLSSTGLKRNVLWRVLAPHARYRTRFREKTQQNPLFIARKQTATLNPGLLTRLLPFMSHSETPLSQPDQLLPEPQVPQDDQGGLDMRYNHRGTKDEC